MHEPVDGRVSQGFFGDFSGGPGSWKTHDGIARGWHGPRRPGATAQSPLHLAIDWACEQGTPLKAVADGKIIRQGRDPYDGAYFLYLRIRTGRFSTLTFAYWHIAAGSFKCKEGDNVSAGQTIAKAGHSGQATGPHLHGELWKAPRLTPVSLLYRVATRLDPRPFLLGRKLKEVAP